MAERDREAPERCCSYHAVQRRLPVLRWLPQYSLQWLQLDLVAGVTVGLTVVPQALAYAEVAGLPVQVCGLILEPEGCARGGRKQLLQVPLQSHLEATNKYCFPSSFHKGTPMPQCCGH